VAATFSRFSAASPSSWMRPPSKALEASERPLSSARSTDGPMNSMKVAAPGSAHLNATSVDEANVSAPVVRSSRTS